MKSRRCTTLVLIALVVLALAPAANAGVDYSKNAAGGDYAPAVAPSAPAPTSTTDSGFEWGDAALGAAAALGVVLLLTGVRRGSGAMRARREPA
jgi:hypothetical protein